MKKGFVTGVLLITLLLLALTFQAIPAPLLSTAAPSASPAPPAPSGPATALRAASGATVRFKTNNGQAMNDLPAQTLDLPHLVLQRDGILTAPAERTLIVEVTDIVVPPTGVTVTLQVETQHGDPDRGGDSGARIPVWRESQWIPNTSGVTALFTHEFGAAVTSDAGPIATPTDYFWYDIVVTDADHPISNPLHAFSEEYALLMENQWTARLPEVREASAGAAPDELTVYYCDMVLFQKSIHDPATRLRREDVSHYVQAELIPQMVEAFRVQADDWGFPWYDAWTSYRLGEDTERLSVALTDGQNWFHGRSPSRGHSGISIKVSGADNARYDTLTDGIMSTFHHKLFHNLQRNLSLNSGRDGNVHGAQNAWQFFSEGMAVLVSSIGQPEVQFGPAAGARAYLSNANHFLGDGGLGGDLNTSYARMNPYRGALCWRFLYEQCGGTRTRDGVEDPAAGMQVIKRTLTALYSGAIVDIGSSTDLVGALPGMMDRVLEGSACPFKTYEESLVAFSAAVYALRLDGGRCTAPGTPTGCGFYDPTNLYYNPPAGTITFAGADTGYAGEIQSSFGVDFVDVVLDPAADGQTPKLEFQGAPGAAAEFNVQLWKLVDSGNDTRPGRIPTQMEAAEVLTLTNADGRLSAVIPAINTSDHNRLGLIITRVDANEDVDPVGAYQITLKSTG